MQSSIHHTCRTAGSNEVSSITDLYLHADERQYLKKKRKLINNDIIHCINNPRTNLVTDKTFAIPKYDLDRLKSNPLFKSLLDGNRKRVSDVDDELINSCKRKYGPTYFNGRSVLPCYLPRLLKYAWSGNHFEMELLLKKYGDEDHDDLNINICDENKRTALHFAASWGDAKMLKLLLGVSEIDIMKKDVDQKTALHHAVEAKSYDSVAMLVRFGLSKADEIFEKELIECLEYAAKNIGDNALQIISFLYEKYFTTFNKKLGLQLLIDLLTASSKQIPVTQCVEELILQGVDVNSTDRHGKSILMYAAERNVYDFARVLIQNNADLQQVDNEGRDAMKYAVKGSDIALMFDIELALSKKG